MNPGPSAVHPALEKAAAYSWRLLVVAALVVAGLYLAGQLLVVWVPVFVALLLARALWPVYGILTGRGLKPALAAVSCVLGFVVVLGAVFGIVGVAVAGEVDEIGPTLEQGIDDITEWLVDESPWDITTQDVERWREQAGDAVASFLRSGQGSVLSGAVVAGEVIVGTILALIVTFFVLKDGRRFVNGAANGLPDDRRPRARAAVGGGWAAAGGYLRGAALLGLVEAIAMGLALWLVGARLVVPVMLITFLSAFVPIVGAVVAGVIAALVALVTAGTVPAVIVAVVALVVQQLDNDLLAPVIYGRSLRLHPLAILLGIATGGALFGFVGTFLAVPVLAMTVNAVNAYRSPVLN